MRVKTIEKRNEFITAAGRLFIEQGFSAVSMEAIAAAAGKSKVTLYNYFSSKEELFEAFVVQAGAGAVEELTTIYAEDASARQLLLWLGQALLRLVSRPDVIALDRLIIGEATRYPELARIFFDNGPKRTTAAIIEVITRCMRSGKLAAGDATMAALHFKALCTNDLIENLMWGTVKTPTKKEMATIAELAVDAFLGGYGINESSITMPER